MSNTDTFHAVTIMRLLVLIQQQKLHFYRILLQPLLRSIIGDKQLIRSFEKFISTKNNMSRKIIFLSLWWGVDYFKHFLKSNITSFTCLTCNFNLKKRTPEVLNKEEVFLKVSQNSQKNTCVRVSLLMQLQTSPLSDFF